MYVCLVLWELLPWAKVAGMQPSGVTTGTHVSHFSATRLGPLGVLHGPHATPEASEGGGLLPYPHLKCLVVPSL